MTDAERMDWIRAQVAAGRWLEFTPLVGDPSVRMSCCVYVCPVGATQTTVGVGESASLAIDDAAAKLAALDRPSS